LIELNDYEKGEEIEGPHKLRVPGNLKGRIRDFTIK